MIGYRALDAGADPLFLGVLASAFAIPALIAALPVGRITDRHGGSGAAVAGMVLLLTGVGLAVALPGLPILLAASTLIGFGQILVVVGLQTFVAHVSTEASSDAGFGTLTAAASVGQLIGPLATTMIATLALLGGTGADPNTTAGMLACVALAIIGALSLAWIAPVDRSLRQDYVVPETPPARTLALLSVPGMWRSLAVSGAVLVTVDLMYAFVPVWAIAQQVSATAVGLLLALRAAVSVVSRYGLTRLVGKFGRRSLIMASVSFAALGLIALPFVGVWGAIPVMIGLGLGLGIPQPLTMAWVTSLTPRESHGATLGLRLTANRLAQITLPLAVGALAAPLGVVGIFWANAALLLAAAGIMVRSRR